jgi:hypothetical protein
MHYFYTPAPRRGRGVYCLTSVRPSFHNNCIYVNTNQSFQYVLSIPVLHYLQAVRFLKIDKMNCELMLTYDTPALRQTGSRNLTGQETIPTIWHTYMKLVTKYQISAINSCWEKCNKKWAYTKCMFNVHKNQQSWQTGSRNLMGPKTRYTILCVAFLNPSDSYFLFADLVGFYTYWTYMHIFRHIFLSNYWRQKSDKQLLRKMRRKISWTDGRTEVKHFNSIPLSPFRERGYKNHKMGTCDNYNRACFNFLFPDNFLIIWSLFISFDVSFTLVYSNPCIQFQNVLLNMFEENSNQPSKLYTMKHALL